MKLSNLQIYQRNLDLFSSKKSESFKYVSALEIYDILHMPKVFITYTPAFATLEDGSVVLREPPELHIDHLVNRTKRFKSLDELRKFINLITITCNENFYIFYVQQHLEILDYWVRCAFKIHDEETYNKYFLNK